MQRLQDKIQIQRFILLLLLSIVVNGFCLKSEAATLRAGAGQTYAKPCAAIAAAADGDTIEIVAGTYTGDVCAISKSNLTIRGVNGRAKLDAGGVSAQGKAIWVIQGTNTTVENIEFTNASVPDHNGAGIRHEGTNLTVRNCYFHNNEMGILTSANAASEVLIENSEFAQQGYGDGYSHNIYIGAIKKFTLRYSHSHDAYNGHLVKSRALENHILYNLLSNKIDGRSAYEIDIPNAGTTYVIGNILHQSPNATNPSFISFGAEGATNPGKDLYVINNTFVNDRSSGTFINNSYVTTPSVIRNNAWVGPGTPSSQGAVSSDNRVATAADFANLSALDVHLKAGSTLIDAGVSPGTSASGVNLTPTRQYKTPLSSEPRPVSNRLDVGAYEFASTTSPTPTATPTSTPIASPTPRPCPTPTPVPTATPRPSATPIATPTPTATPAPAPPTVVRFVLIDADRDVSIKTLRNGDVIHLGSIGATRLTIRAVTEPRRIGRVEFAVNGASVGSDMTNPYSIAGDRVVSGYIDYQPWSYTLNTPYTVSARPIGTDGKAGPSLSVSFRIVSP